MAYDLQQNKAFVIRTDIQSKLLDIHPRVFHGDAPADTEYPFVLYNLPNAATLDRVDVIDLEIDIWDDKSTTSDLEVLTDRIDKALHRYTGGNEHVFYTIYRENRLSIRDPEVILKRRQLVFQIRTMGVND